MTGKEIIHFTSDGIEMQIGNHPQKVWVMHNAEKSLMERLADIATQNGGNILEIGFGMGLCSNRIQQNPKISKHTIIEVHPDIYKKALEWAVDKPNVNILLGDWLDVIPHLKDIKFDGVLHDTCSDPNIYKFIDVVKPICNRNCVVAFFLNTTDTDLDIIYHSLEDDEYNRLPYKNVPNFKDNSYKIKFKIIN